MAVKKLPKNIEDINILFWRIDMKRYFKISIYRYRIDISTSPLDRKHCRMLVGLLTGHINLQYMLHKIRRAKTPHARDVVQKRKRRYIFYDYARCWKRKGFRP